MLTAHGVTHPGRVRKINEDTFLCDLDEALFVVGDGMGGHHAGEVASKLAVEAIHVFLARTRSGDKVTWPYGIDPALSFDGNRLATAIRIANRRVFKASEESEEYFGMGTTVAVALASEGRIVFSSVGDSRIYSFSQGALTQLTQDDSWVRMLMVQGALDPAAIERHPMKHVLINVVGARDHLECVVSERELDRQETFLLCSDGLHGALDRPTIESILGSNASPEELAETLVGRALERGGTDNITALVVRFDP